MYFYCSGLQYGLIFLISYSFLSNIRILNTNISPCKYKTLIAGVGFVIWVVSLQDPTTLRRASSNIQKWGFGPPLYPGYSYCLRQTGQPHSPYPACGRMGLGIRDSCALFISCDSQAVEETPPVWIARELPGTAVWAVYLPWVSKVQAVPG